MGRTKLTMEEKTRALTLMEQGVPVKHVAANLNVSRVSLFKLKKAATTPHPSTALPCKPGSGGKKTTGRTDKILVREVKQDPSITVAELKKNHPDVLHNFAICTIQHRLQKDLGLPCCQEAAADTPYEGQKAGLCQKILSLDRRPVDDSHVQ